VRDPTPLGDLIEGVLAGYGVARPRDAVVLLEEWESVAPAPWATRAHPVSLTDGVLEVRVADGATASLLGYQRQGLISALTERFGAGLVTAVKVVVERRAERSQG